MQTLREWLRRNAAVAFAVPLLTMLFLAAQAPRLMSRTIRPELDAQFRFARKPLPLAQDIPLRGVREVHPSLKRISAWISSVGAAVALGDIDGDGLSNDVCHVEPRNDTVTVSRVHGSAYAPFRLVAGAELLDPQKMAPMGCLISDINEDGLADLVVYYWGRTPIAFIRKGSAIESASFRPYELVKGGERWYTNAGMFADVDGDGHLDLIIGNYFQDGGRILDAKASGREELHSTKSRSYNGGSKRFLLWRAGAGPDGLPGFEDATTNLSQEARHGWNLAVGAADLDGDLLPDFYFAHDFGPDKLLHNRSRTGKLEFAVIEGTREMVTPSSAVLGKDSFKGMGVDFADMNRDGIPDIYVSNIADEYALQESHMVWESNGDRGAFARGESPYRQNSERLGLSRSGWGWDARFADFNNDGRFEALQATGFLKGSINRWPELQALGTGNDSLMHDAKFWPRFRPGDDVSGNNRTAFFALGPDGRYHNMPYIVTDEPTVSRGVAIGDVDGDGRLDFVMANQWEDSFAYLNEGPQAGSFVGLHLQHGDDFRMEAGHHSWGSPAIGATATVHLKDGTILHAQSDGGSGHSGKRSPDIHFGLGAVAPDSVLSVDLAWRSRQGKVQKRVVHVKPGQWYTVRLGA
ncbi:RNA-binding protein [Bryobacterales bacterium F-183]|nr:RNA-binding protein [Bryobacterales bacterium F-183]